MVSKVILVWPFILLVITAIIAVALYLFHDNTVKYDSSWAIASYCGSLLSGVALGVTTYMAFKKKSIYSETTMTSPMSIQMDIV